MRVIKLTEDKQKIVNEDDVPVGGLFKNQYGAVCWKVRLEEDEFTDGNIPVIVVLKPADNYYKEDDRYEDGQVFQSKQDVLVEEYYGIVKDFTEATVY